MKSVLILLVLISCYSTSKGQVSRCGPCFCNKASLTMMCSGLEIRSLKTVSRTAGFWTRRIRFLSLYKTNVYDLKVIKGWTSVKSVMLRNNSNVNCEDITYLKLNKNILIQGWDMQKCDTTSTNMMKISSTSHLQYYTTEGNTFTFNTLDQSSINSHYTSVQVEPTTQENNGLQEYTKPDQHILIQSSTSALPLSSESLKTTVEYNEVTTNGSITKIPDTTHFTFTKFTSVKQPKTDPTVNKNTVTSDKMSTTTSDNTIAVTSNKVSTVTSKYLSDTTQKRNTENKPLSETIPHTDISPTDEMIILSTSLKANITLKDDGFITTQSSVTPFTVSSKTHEMTKEGTEQMSSSSHLTDPTFKAVTEFSQQNMTTILTKNSSFKTVTELDQQNTTLTSNNSYFNNTIHNKNYDIPLGLSIFLGVISFLVIVVIWTLFIWFCLKRCGPNQISGIYRNSRIDSFENPAYEMVLPNFDYDEDSFL